MNAKSWLRGAAPYVLAVLSVVLMLPVCRALERESGGQVLVILLVIPILVSAYVGGWGPGLAATGLAVFVTAYFLLPPVESLRIARSNDRLQWLALLVTGVLITILNAVLHRSRARLKESRESLRRCCDDLDQRIQERTVALNQTNADLHAEIAERGRVEETLRRHEVELRDNSEVLRLAQEVARVGTFEWDLVQDRIHWTPELEALYGLAAGTFGGTWSDFARLVHPDDLSKVEQLLRDVLAGGRVEGEWRIVRADHQQVCWIAARGRVFMDAAGKPARMVGVNFDITKLKRAEDALFNSRQMLRMVLDHIPQRVFWKDLSSTYVGCNMQKARDCGCADPSEVVGKTDYDTASAVNAERYRADDRQVMETGESKLNYEEPQIKPDGSQAWLRTSKVPLRDREGRVIGVLGTYEDITVRKLAEEALRASERRFRSIMDRNVIAIVFFDPEGRVTQANDAFLRLVGYDAEDVRAGRVQCSQLTPPESAARTAQAVEELRTRGYCDPYEKEYIHRDGRRVPVLLGGAMLEGGKEGVAFMVETSERKALERELRRAKQAAEAASAAKDHFLAVLSHELRTPLTPVLATVSMLLGEPQLEGSLREGLEMIGRNAELEARLIDDLLDVTRIARGKVVLEKRPVELARIIRHAIEVCRPDMEDRQFHFSVELAGAAGCVVEADAARLQQVFWNLLKNAIKFTPDGGVITVRAWSEDDHAVVEVKDNGAGIEGDALVRIFNPFEQAERSIIRQFGGLGLGLAITKALVDLHGGAISVCSAGKNQGATFRVRLPLKATHKPLASPLAEAPPAAASRVPARPLRILLVEDHHDTARIMQRLLESEGHQVTYAATVAAAFKLAQKESFDLLLSDLGLPDASGLELVRMLRSAGHRLPAVALSGYGQEEDLQRSRAVGFAAHLTKPINLATLDRVIREVTAVSDPKA